MTNDIKMETPPSSPQHRTPHSSPPLAARGVFHLPPSSSQRLSSPSGSPTTTSTIAATNTSSPTTNTANTTIGAAPTTPSTPLTIDPIIIGTPSTPSNTGVEGSDGLFGLNIAKGRHTDLTPVIRNVTYVDGSANNGGNNGVGTDYIGGVGGDYGGGVGGVDKEFGGLRQRRLPLPRGSVALKGGGCDESVFFPTSSSVSAVSSGVGRSGSNSGGGSNGGMSEEQVTSRVSNNQHSSNTSHNNMEEEQSSMDQSTLQILMHDESSLDSSSRSSSTNNKRSGGGEHTGSMLVHHRQVKKSKEVTVPINSNSNSSPLESNGGADSSANSFLLAPIELKPERKFFSFQGEWQYRQSVPNHENDGDHFLSGSRSSRIKKKNRLETIYSPPRSSAAAGGVSHVMDSSSQVVAGGNMEGTPSGSSGTSTPKQYEPWERSQFGVTDMADTKDLDAIFKSPRVTTTTGGSGTTTPRGMNGEEDAFVVTPAKNDEDYDTPQNPDTATMTNNNNNSTEHLQQPFPLPEDRLYSIPSIRLANAVHRTDSLASYEMSYYDGTFSEEDDSTWGEGSYYCDDEDSLSSSLGSMGSSLRRRQFITRHYGSGSGRMSFESLEGMGLLSRQNSVTNANNNGGEGGMMEEDGGEGGGGTTAPSIAPSNSFLERMQGITINQRSNTYESMSEGESLQGPAPPIVLNVDESNPALMINATQSMDDAEYETRQDRRVRRSNHHGHRSSRRRRSSHARTSSAVEWIQGLKNPNNGGGVQIVEAASSKFLIGGADGGGGGVEEAVQDSEDVSKALGMPHPLCRSTTIEAGPFVNRAAAAVASSGLGAGIGE